MTALDQLPHRLDPVAFTCEAIVESPAGTRVKVYYDRLCRSFRTGKLLPLGMVFPLDFAFIPSTLGGDGDAIDLLILPEAALPVGSIVKVRILGILEAQQNRPDKRPMRNDRVIARLDDSRLHANVDDLEQLGPRFVEELSSFFATYKRLRGRTYEVLGVGGPGRAAELIEQGSTALFGSAIGQATRRVES